MFLIILIRKSEYWARAELQTLVIPLILLRRVVILVGKWQMFGQNKWKGLLLEKKQADDDDEQQQQS